MQHWLVKTEPESYSWDDLVRDKSTPWDGVRNYQARNNLQKIQVGDKVMVYHSGKTREVVGIAEATSVAYQDPTTDDERWVAVDIVPLEELKRGISLKEIKRSDRLEEIALIRQSRLSVLPLRAAEFAEIIAMTKEEEK